jgi:hypothetical protein
MSSESEAELTAAWRAMAEAIREQRSGPRTDEELTRVLALKGELAWYTTELAALYLHRSEKALQMLIARGTLKPDTYGGRGKSKCHMFRIKTLDTFLADDNAA